MKRTYTAEEAWNEIGVSRTKFYDMAKKGQIQVVKAGKKILVPCWAVSEFLQETKNAQG